MTCGIHQVHDQTQQVTSNTILLNPTGHEGIFNLGLCISIGKVIASIIQTIKKHSIFGKCSEMNNLLVEESVPNSANNNPIGNIPVEDGILIECNNVS